MSNIELRTELVAQVWGRVFDIVYPHVQTIKKQGHEQINGRVWNSIQHRLCAPVHRRTTEQISDPWRDRCGDPYPTRGIPENSEVKRVLLY
jgi:hypothetical protein